LGFVLADAGQMEQVILNLAVDARAAMPKAASLFLKRAMWNWAIPLRTPTI